MELIYLWINEYKNIKNAGFVLNPKYEDNSPEEENTDDNIKLISLTEKVNYTNVFGENLNIITIVGKNGSGKSNLINILSYILRSISSVSNTKSPDKNKYDYEDIPDSCKYCLIIKEDTQYIAFCSDNCINEINAEIKTKGNKDPLKTFYFDSIYALNRNIPFVKKRIKQSGNHNYRVAKFQPFYRGEDSNPVEFTLWNSIENITKIKLKNYFYYDRFRLYDTVRNLMELYEFNSKNKLNIFNDNCELIFNKYSPYVNIIDALQWANKRVQDNKEEVYDITQIVSNSTGQLSRQMKTPKSMKYVLNTVFPKFFFIYALGEILEIKKYKKYKDDNRKMIITPFNKKIIKNLSYENYKDTSKRVEFYDKCFKSSNNKRLKNMFTAYIKYENDPRIKKQLEKYYTLEGNILKLKNSILFADINKKYIKDIESLKGISKNIYMDEEYDFMSLSTGEQRLMRFMADIYYCANVLKKNDETNIFLFDEMDLSWHPEWQRKMINYIHDIFKKITSLSENQNRKFNLIFTTHSPFILSDMPKDNVIFLNEGDNLTKNVDLKTFGANIHDLFNCGLFLKCDKSNTIGEFAANFIKQDILKDIKKLNHNNQKQIEAKINLIGEPLIKNMLLDKLYSNPKYIPERESVEYLKTLNKELLKKINELEKKNKNEKV